MTVFTNQGTGKSRVSFASPYPGKIIPMDLSDWVEKSFVRKMPFYVPLKAFQSELIFNAD
jgi:uncharacterized protein (AIM24 family)